jgi:hypothetical protein
VEPWCCSNNLRFNLHCSAFQIIRFARRNTSYTYQ